MREALQPRRELAFPALVVAAPVAYVAYRMANSQVAAGSSIGVWPLTLAALSLVAGYLAAVAVAATVDVGEIARRSRIARALFRPGDATLAVLGALVALAAGYLLATLLVDLPGPVDAVATPVGLLLGAPLVVVWTVTVAAGNALGEPAMWLQMVAVGAGVACSAAWTFVLATVVTRVTGVD
jgi:hypothetical protein